MPAPGHNGRASPDADPHVFGPAAPARPPDPPAAPVHADDVSVGKRLARVLLVMAVIAAAGVVAVRTGATTLSGAHDGTETTQAGARASLAAQRTAADEQWASATCTNILEWKNELQRDGTSAGLGFGALARIQDAIAATTRMLNELDKLGLPPVAQTAQARADADQLRSEIESHAHDIAAAADGVASGNLASIGTLLSGLESDKVLATQIVGELRRVASVDLGLSLVETRACRELVGIPI